MGSLPLVTPISECFIKPKAVEHKGQRAHYRLTPWDLAFLSRHYNHQGLLYANPQIQHTQQHTGGERKHQTPWLDIERLKASLSSTLAHFYPLAGRLASRPDPQDPDNYCYTHIDCGKGPGARFVHARTGALSASDVLSARFPQETAASLFDHHDGAINHDGHSRPTLTVQVTELLDGVFIGCSMNHATSDGTSFWHFINTWSEIYADDHPANPPVHHQRRGMFPDEIRVPLLRPSEFAADQEGLILQEFRFSRGSISELKARANAEHSAGGGERLAREISSLQALSALTWRAITRARGVRDQDELTLCELAADNRRRLDPPFSPHYFGNCEQDVFATTTVGRLTREYSVGQAAALLNRAVAGRDDAQAREFVDRWVRSPYYYPPNPVGRAGVSIASSPRFNMYGNEFGMGRPLAVRGGYGNMFDGKVSANEGSEGPGSINLEIYLQANTMEALESDQEFMAVASSKQRGEAAAYAW